VLAAINLVATGVVGGEDVFGLITEIRPHQWLLRQLLAQRAPSSQSAA
jgi:hypothetical protein